MNTGIGVTHRDPPVVADRSAAHEIEGGSTTEAVGGAAAIVLAILALIGILPFSLASVAAIAVGVGLVVAGGAIAARYRRVLAVPESGATRREIVGGMGMEATAGIAAVVLGILALLGIATTTLLAASAIAAGAGLLMASGSMARLESLVRWETLQDSSRAHDPVYASAGSEVIVGLGAVVLGILALTGIDPLTMILVAMLAIGASLLMSGSAIAGTFVSRFR
ncbi:MAG TPA: hypothetical protein VJU87_05910 [Gemmatimonadaceae bacterium]|nr:hypothetical protein [Gemmatimonadaceae bacterium]